MLRYGGSISIWFFIFVFSFKTFPSTVYFPGHYTQFIMLSFITSISSFPFLSLCTHTHTRDLLELHTLSAGLCSPFTAGKLDLHSQLHFSSFSRHTDGFLLHVCTRPDLYSSTLQAVTLRRDIMRVVLYVLFYIVCHASHHTAVLNPDVCMGEGGWLVCVYSGQTVEWWLLWL